ncbi:MAG: hypothetical protein ACJAVW_003357, partial [Spirosomataceae bacterium]
MIIPTLDVKELMNVFLNDNIETLRNCEDVNGCVIGADGLSYRFNITITELNRSYSYWEPEND